MGKRIIAQRRGHGSSRYRAPSHRYAGCPRIPNVSKAVGVVERIFHDPGHTAPLAEVRLDNGKKFLNEVKTRAHINNCSYLEAMEKYLVRLSEPNKEFLRIIDSARAEMDRLMVPRTVLHRLLSSIKLEENLMIEHGPEEGIERYEALDMLATMIDMSLPEYGSYKEVLSELSISESDDFEKTDENKVQLMTVHAAKGLEFEHVYIVGAVDGIMPSINASLYRKSKEEEEKEEDKYAQSNLEEERRIFYVALSRAKEELLISSPYYIYRNGKTSAYERTMFLNGKDHLFNIKRI